MHAEVIGASPRLEATALAASVAAAAVGLFLSVALLGRAERWSIGLLSDASGETLLLIASAWLSLAVVGVVSGFIALVLARRRRPRAVVAVVLSVVSLLAVPCFALAAASAAAGPHHPADEELIDNFQAHEAGFAALARDVTQHGTSMKSELRRLGVESLERNIGDAFFLYVSSYGIVPSGSAKGYAYSPGLNGPTVDSLDDVGGRDGYTYRHLKGPWYLFYESW